MKAFLLAAGFGTRLKPITDTTPKCLVPIKGKPLLYYWMKLCDKYKIQEVLINLHYLPDMVINFLKENRFAVTVRTVFEKELRGSGGTILHNKDFVRDEESFFIFYADNLTDVNLAQMDSFHKKHNEPLTIGLFNAEVPKECGIVELDKDKKVISFEEKPERPKSNLANAGVYLARQEIFSFFPQEKKKIDFGFDILPKLVKRMYGFVISEYLIDIGTMEKYIKAQKEWKGLKEKN